MPDKTTAYVIKPRTGEFVDYESWIKVENQLRLILQAAVSNNNSISAKQKYFTSATELEVNQGVYPYREYSDINIESKKGNETEYNLDLEYVYGFIREINPGNNKTEQSIFFDSNNER